MLKGDLIEVAGTRARVVGCHVEPMPNATMREGRVIPIMNGNAFVYDMLWHFHTSQYSSVSIPGKTLMRVLRRNEHIKRMAMLHD